jgi:protein-S-isoprenylcysteine O-methyltransferase Ste14
MMRRLGRAIFCVLALGGALWWALVFAGGWVRSATLGELPPGPVAALDLPLFVLASALAAAGVRWAAAVAAPWTAFVAVGMAVYASVTGLAGWGAVAMICAAACVIPAAFLVWMGRVPTEWLLRGPFRFRSSRLPGTAAVLGSTLAQLVVFWGLFLGVLPWIILWCEVRWGLHVDAPGWLRFLGAAVFLAASALGVWSAVTMSVAGHGTPLPQSMARELVVTGPYRWVRNPMAVAGVAQGAAVGIMLGSWMTVAYAVCGALLWNAAIRPHEEADLSERFGESFERYRRSVACWWPRRPSDRSQP